MGWLIAFGLLLLIALIPLGIRLIYNQDGLYLSFLAGWIRIALYPREKKDKSKEKKDKPDRKKTSGQNAKGKEKTQGGKLKDFMPLVDTALAFLGSLRKKLRVRQLVFHLVMAADDPCDLAVNYGKAWAAVGNILPLLEQIFVIKKRDVEVQCDFTAETTTLYVRFDLTITIGRALSLILKYGIRALRQYLRIIKSNKGGAVK